MIRNTFKAKGEASHLLTSDQVDAITHAWLDLCASWERFESEEQFSGVVADELAAACFDSIKELEQEFPFLLEGVEDA
jgi:hypothetical protein